MALFPHTGLVAAQRRRVLVGYGRGYRHHLAGLRHLFVFFTYFHFNGFVRTTLHIFVITAAFGFALSANAFAHGNEVHGNAAQAVKKEQKDWGIAGDAKKARRTIQIRMLDTMRFSPNKIKVKQGETIKFVIKNTGAMLHEFVIGTPQ